MYPTISHLIYDLFGVFIPLPIQTFGFWVAMAFLAASWTLTLELKRKENEGILKATIKKKIIGSKLKIGDYIFTAFTSFIIGFKLIEAIFHYEELVANPQLFILSTRGSIVGGIVITIINIYLKWKENQKHVLKEPKLIEEKIHPFQLVGNITMLAALSGVIGAKIFHNLENFGDFLANPIGELISFSGLTFYGGLIAGAISVIWYTKKYKINALQLCDATAPGLMIAYGIGRIGCQMSGDGDWGIVNTSEKPLWLDFLPDWMWSYNFPHNVINAGVPMQDCGEKFWYPYCYELAQPVFPTAFYETVLATIIFSILWSIRKKIKIPGILFCIYLCLNGLERFFIEKIRVNTKYNILGGITQAEIISSCLILIGIIGIYILYKGNKNNSKIKPV